MSGLPQYSSGPSEQVMYGSWTSSMADHSQVPVHLPNPGEPGSSAQASQFTLLRPDYNSDHLGGGLFGQTAKPNQIGIDKRAIASEFHDQLKSFASHLEECEQRYELTAYPPEHKEKLKAYKDQAQNFKASVQDLITEGGGAMGTTPFHEDGTPTQGAWDAFMRNFLSTDRQLQTTQDLMRNMNWWLIYYQADCPPKHFVFLGQEVGVDDFAQTLVSCGECVYGDQSPATGLLRDFARLLMRVVYAVSRIREHEPLFEIKKIAHKWSKAKGVIDSLLQGRASLYARIRGLVAACEAAMPVPYRHGDGSIKYYASKGFMGALFDEGRQLGELEAIRWDMNDWLESYNRDCAPLFRRIRENAESFKRHAQRQAARRR